MKIFNHTQIYSNILKKKFNLRTYIDECFTCVLASYKVCILAGEGREKEKGG